jgi:hypothetical protein
MEAFSWKVGGLENETFNICQFPRRIGVNKVNFCLEETEMGAAEEISLRPLALRPQAGVNPFASFAHGAGMNLKNKVCFVIAL